MGAEARLIERAAIDHDYEREVGPWTVVSCNKCGHKKILLENCVCAIGMVRRQSGRLAIVRRDLTGPEHPGFYGTAL